MKLRMNLGSRSLRAALPVVCAVILAATAWSAEEPPLADARSPYDVTQAPWPCWRGPYFNGSAPEQGLKLIDDLGKAPLLWTGDMPIPRAHPSRGAAGWACGYSSPIVAQGRVYVAYWTPPGRTDYGFTKEDSDPRHVVKRGRNPVNGYADLSADDVLHCFDAKTGKTLYRTVLAGEGLMRPGTKQGCHMTPCWWDGKVFFSGSAGRNYCIDATTGELLWESETSMSKTQDALKKQGKANYREYEVNYAAPVAVQDVVAIPDGGALIGYDAGKGTVLWKVDGLPGSTSVATPWMQGGKGYFICKGKLIEARTGKVRWEIPDPPGSAPSAVAGDILVMPNRGGTYRKGMSDAEAPPKSMTAFRISPEQYEQLWQLPYPTPHGSQYNPGFIHRGHAYGRMYRHPDTGAREEVFVRVPLATGKPEVLATGRHEATTGYSPSAFEGRLLRCNASRFLHVDGSGKPEIRPGPATAAVSTSSAYADGLLYFRTESNTDGRLVCYDLRAGGK